MRNAVGKDVFFFFQENAVAAFICASVIDAQCPPKTLKHLDGVVLLSIRELFVVIRGTVSSPPKEKRCAIVDSWSEEFRRHWIRTRTQSKHHLKWIPSIWTELTPPGLSIKTKKDGILLVELCLNAPTICLMLFSLQKPNSSVKTDAIEGTGILHNRSFILRWTWHVRRSGDQMTEKTVTRNWYDCALDTITCFEMS